MWGKIKNARFEISFCYASCVNVQSDQITVTHTQYTG